MFPFAWLTGAGLAFGGLAWGAFGFNRVSPQARAAEARRAKIIEQLARGGPIDEMCSLLARSLEESCPRIRCSITLIGPVYSPEDYPVEESPGAVFPIVDAGGSRVGVLSIDPPLEKLTRKETEAIDGIRHLAAIIAEQRSMHSELQILVRQDRLTGLENGFAFSETLERLTQNRPEKAWALFGFDLDRFRHVNGRLGHAAGDIYLRQAAERIRKCFRADDLVARIGADDFAALAQGLSAAEAAGISRCVIDAFRAPFSIQGLAIVGSVSVGVTAFPGGGRTPEELRLSAEAALAEARKAGGGRFVICSPEIRERAASIFNTARLIRQALDDNSVSLFYQPRIGTSGELSGMEALVCRVVTPETAFIPLTEADRMALDADLWILAEAIRQYAEWVRKGLNPVRMSVEVSRCNLSRDGTFDRILSFLTTFGLGTEAIQIDVSEPAALSEDRSLEVLWKLRSAGISVALKVFGSGYSAPNGLGGLPVDAIKFDKTFVASLTAADKTTPLASALIAAARASRMTIFATGIETEKQMWAIRRMGCDVLQGDYIARPFTAMTAGEALAERLKMQSSGRD
jgi:diguanylate cyclase (GGDEF)-like protein